MRDLTTRGVRAGGSLAAPASLLLLLTACGTQGAAPPQAGSAGDVPTIRHLAATVRAPDGAPAEAGAGPAVRVAAAAPVQVAQAPTQDEVDRALERSLVEEGGLTLPPFQVEIRPELQYSYREERRLSIVDVDGQPTLAETDERLDTLDAAVTGRMGLPGAWQVQATVPWRFGDEQTAGGGRILSSSEGADLGDVEVGVTKQLFRERGLLPNLLGNLTWRIPTGESAEGGERLATGSGAHALQAALTFVRSQDPLVFFGSASYTHTFDDTRDGQEFDFGSQFGLRAGTILAASPETSLRLAFQADFLGELEVAGVEQAGSDQVVSQAELGMATVLTDRLLLDISAGFGLSGDAPDFLVSVSLPYRF